MNREVTLVTTTAGWCATVHGRDGMAYSAYGGTTEEALLKLIDKLAGEVR